MPLSWGNWNFASAWDESTIFLLSGTMPCKTITSLISSVVKGYGAGESVIPGILCWDRLIWSLVSPTGRKSLGVTLIWDFIFEGKDKAIENERTTPSGSPLHRGRDGGEKVSQYNNVACPPPV